MKLFVIWNNATNVIEMAEKTDQRVNVMSADPHKGTALINLPEVDDFKAGFRAQGYPESEIKKIDDALKN